MVCVIRDMGPEKFEGRWRVVSCELIEIVAGVCSSG